MNHLDTNKKLADIFKEMSAIYKYMGSEERFRSLSYNKAYHTIQNLNEDITFYVNNNTLEDLPGIGKSISDKIKEFVTTGSIEKYQFLKKNAPVNLLELLSVKGFGPKSIKQIHENLNVNTKEKLLNVLQNGEVEKLKGFGKKKVELLLRGLKTHDSIKNRMLLWDALLIGEYILEWFKDCKVITHIELAGSLRRKKETIGDIDLLISSKLNDREEIISRFVNPDFAKSVLVKGDTKVSIVLLNYEKQVDLRMVNDDEWWPALQYFTGSKEHNITLRRIAKDKGYKVSEYGIVNHVTQKKVSVKTEDDMYSIFGLQTIPPEMRENNGEFELSKKNKIPQLISLNDIKGDLHIHTLWSDGLYSINDIVQFVKKNYSYDYIGLADHSKSSRIAHGIDEKMILKQLQEVKSINNKLGENFVKSGIEVDILLNGKLDISDEILSQLDWVTASIHNGFKSDNTDRIVRACENPNVNCIAHPTGRLIGLREPYKVDITKIMEVAKHTNTALEINCQPERMDLKDEYAKLAQLNSVKLLINSDSHSLKTLDYMNLGVCIAKRAWCSKDHILNTKKWVEIEKLKKTKRDKMLVY